MYKWLCFFAILLSTGFTPLVIGQTNGISLGPTVETHPRQDFSKGVKGTFIKNKVSLVPGVSSENIYQSAPIPIPFPTQIPFFSISGIWNLSDVYCSSGFKFEFRVSKDVISWSEWQDFSLDTHCDGGKHISAMKIVKAEFLFIQIQAIGPDLSSCSVEGLELHFFNPFGGEMKEDYLIEEEPGSNENSKLLLPNNIETIESFCPCPAPGFVNRSSWGGPPYFVSGTPQYTTVSHLIIHHSATSNVSSNWGAVVLSIYNFHVNTNGWSDIGYNYLIAPNGTIYEGRHGGNNVIGSHFCGTNVNTFGVCMLGDFSGSPVSTSANNSLVDLLAWKSCDSNINPLTSSSHSIGGALNHISGHNNGCSTTCPGAGITSQLPTIRSAVQSEINNCSSASTQPNLTLQANSATASASGTNVSISLTVENVGTASAGSSTLGYYLSSDVYFDPSDYLIGTDGVNSLASGGTDGESINVDVATLGIPTGAYVIIFVIDKDDDVIESDETDNIFLFTSPIVVIPQGPQCNDPYEPNDNSGSAHSITVSFTGNTFTWESTGACNDASENDTDDYYSLGNLPNGYTYDISVTPIHNPTNSSYSGSVEYRGYDLGNGTTYTSSHTYSNIQGGTSPYFKVEEDNGSFGTYEFKVVITRTVQPQNYSINLSASPSSGGNTNGGGTFTAGQSISVNASPNSGYVFDNWTENGLIVSSNASYSFTVTNTRNLVANFSQNPSQYNVVLSSSPQNGGTTSGNGTFQGGQSVTVVATPSNGYSFVNWTENGNTVSSQPSYSFQINSNRVLTANFSTNGGNQVVLTLNSIPSSGGTLSGAGTYSLGQTVNISATPNNGFQFLNWTENGIIISTTLSENLVLNSNRSIEANFQSNTSGEVLSLIANPTVGGILAGEGVYTSGDIAQLTAVSNPGYKFDNWTQNGTVLSQSFFYLHPVTTTETLLANFSTIPSGTYNVSLATSDPNAGNVTGAGVYAGGITANLSAQSQGNWTFLHWEEQGVIVSTSSNFSFPINSNRSLLAVFVSPTSTYDKLVNYQPNVFPNPTRGIIYLELPEESIGMVNVNIYDLRGRLVNQSINLGMGNRVEIDLSDLPTGLYLLSVRSEDQIYTGRVYKQ